MFLRCRNLESTRIASTLNALPQSPFQPVNIKYPKTKVDHRQANQPAWYSQYHGYITFQFPIATPVPQEVLLHLDTRSESSLLFDGFRNWKNALCKAKGFHKHESSLCHIYAVTMLTQPSHVDEQLKEQLKSQRRYRNCLQKSSKVYPIIPAKALLFIHEESPS